VLQLMQIVGDQKVRVVPDVAVSGNGGSSTPPHATTSK